VQSEGLLVCRLVSQLPLSSLTGRFLWIPFHSNVACMVADNLAVTKSIKEYFYYIGKNIRSITPLMFNNAHDIDIKGTQD
jgi:hypothetical protein